MFAAGEALAPGVLHIQPRQQRAQPDSGQRGADGGVGEVGGAGGIAGGVAQAAERQVRALRQDQGLAGRRGAAAGAITVDGKIVRGAFPSPGGVAAE